MHFFLTIRVIRVIRLIRENRSPLSWMAPSFPHSGLLQYWRWLSS